MKKLAFTPNFIIPDELPRVIKLLDTIDSLHFKKDITLVEASNYLKEIPSYLIKKIVLHTHQTLALQFAVKGIHISESQRLTGMVGGVSTSCHRLEDLVEVSEKFEYVFFSPVFPSISKQNYLPKYSLTEISHFLKKNELKNIIALGGVKPEMEPLLKEVGFAGVASLGYYWS